MSSFGLLSEELNSIVKTLEKFSEVKEAKIYGSRAMGTFRDGSDIDLVLLGERLTTSLLLQVMVALDDLDLVYLFDVSIWHELINEDLKAHINRVGKTIYLKKSL